MDAFLKKFVESVPRTNGRKPSVLDLGCGKGLATLALAREGFNVIAIDSQNRMLIDHDNITYIQEDIVTWLRRLSPNAAFDGIIMRNLLQFMDEKTVREELIPLVSQHIASDGVVGIQTFYHPVVPTFPRPHVSYWKVEDLQALFTHVTTVMAIEEPDYHPDVRGEDRQFFMTNFVVKNA
ncbi:MAG: class I SAM-dependent methyltransferase [Candidatus Uhrbacteria bacterium]|nr:class I SAM-dependent methyltransferase [Candidatus Uhrbacteria bacterium]